MLGADHDGSSCRWRRVSGRRVIGRRARRGPLGDCVMAASLLPLICGRITRRGGSARDRAAATPPMPDRWRPGRARSPPSRRRRRWAVRSLFTQCWRGRPLALDNALDAAARRGAVGNRRPDAALQLAVPEPGAAAEVKRASRSGRPLSLLFVDLDGFKAVNDVHGHLAGSRALVEAARVIRGSARETDVVARFGGDEFSLILPDTGSEGAAAVAERVRERIAGHRFSPAIGLAIRLTVSVGVATLPDVADRPKIS